MYKFAYHRQCTVINQIELVKTLYLNERILTEIDLNEASRAIYAPPAQCCFCYKPMFFVLYMFMILLFRLGLYCCYLVPGMSMNVLRRLNAYRFFWIAFVE